MTNTQFKNPYPAESAATIEQISSLDTGDSYRIPRRRRLGPPCVMTGRERRRINPNNGLIKVLERKADLLISRFIYPHLAHFWTPYTSLLNLRFTLAETAISPRGWPEEIAPLRVLLLSDIHAGIFLAPSMLARIVNGLMRLKPDLVAIAGDLVTGHSSEVHPFVEALAPLSRAPLGAWFCYGNHDYFGGDPEEIRSGLRSAGIATLKNETAVIRHGAGEFVLGGLDDRILGRPDWAALRSQRGMPHILLAHNPDVFYEAAASGVPLVLSGHTHGGQIRLPAGPPIIRQSKFCLDEGVYAYEGSLLVVSRGMGSVLLPWRWGADPEAVLIEITPPS